MEVDESADSDNTVKVLPTMNITDHRIRDKKFHCLFSSMEVSQLPHHLYAAHKDEVEVAELLSCSDRNRRAVLLMKLRNMGDHIHNLNTIHNQSGSLQVAYRTSQKMSASSNLYVPCSYCYGWYRREQLWRHVKRCQLAPDDGSGKARRPLTTANSIAIGLSQETVMSVLGGMRQGSVFSAIKNDSLVHDLIRMMMSKVGNSYSHVNYVRSHVRNLGRVLLEVRKAVPELKSASVRDMIAPQYFAAIVSAVKAISGYDTKSYAPSTGVNVSHDLNFCADMVKTAALMDGDLTTAGMAENFEAVMRSRWKYEISCGARLELQKRSFNNPQLLPLTSDVMKLTQYLKEQQMEALSAVSGKVQCADFCS